jgi:hypothetical protein
MRIGMVSSFCAFLLWIYSPLPAVAQVGPVSEQRLRALSSVKLFELPNIPVSGGVRFRTDFAIELPKAPQFDKQPHRQQEGVGPIGTLSPSEDIRCAHILVYRAPAVDSKMIIQVPTEFNSNMPKLGGLLQPCCGDFRGLMLSPQLAPVMQIAPRDPNSGMQLWMRLLGVRP